MAAHHLCTTLFLFCILHLAAATHQRVPETDGLFVFGSSLVDNGNNNFLPNTTAKANYSPYGIDSAMGPSGRFTNGKNVIDALGELLGLPEHIPPFLDPRTEGRTIVHGVNYASGGSGILDNTGSIGGKVMSLKEQINNFETKTLPELKAMVGHHGGGETAAIDLSKYIFVVGTGGNDYLLNYYVKSKVDGIQDLESFTRELITTLYSHLERLHRLGARKFILMSVQAIGCVPVVRSLMQPHNDTSSSCVETINQSALLFNSHLRSLVDLAMSHMHGSHMVYVNSYDVIKDLIHSPSIKGFKETRKACCEVEWSNGILCREGGKTCGDRQSHIFFDGLHPTEAVNFWLANKAYRSKRLRDVYPINVQHLAEI